MTTDSPTDTTTSPAQVERSRFPYVTAYMGLYAGTFLISLPLTLLMLSASVTQTPLFRLVVFSGNAVLTFFVFRWAIKKHIEPYVPANTTLLLDQGSRFSLKNPYILGAATYMALNAFGQACTQPPQDWFASQLDVSTNFLLQLFLDGLIGFFPFAIAVKHVVFKPYRLRRLLPFLGLLSLLTFLTVFAIAAVQVRQVWAFRNHIYCELLMPGLPKAEVDAALKPIGLQFQVNWEREELHGPPIARAVAFTTPRFDTPEVEYGLRLVLAYDNEQKLVLVGREFGIHNYEPVECPLSFR